jgi:hypothetical protein
MDPEFSLQYRLWGGLLTSAVLALLVTKFSPVGGIRKWLLRVASQIEKKSEKAETINF